MNQSKRYFCFGLGYTGLKLAGKLATVGWRVAGTTRTLEKCRQLESQGIQAHLFQGDQAFEHVQVALNDVTHILVSIPPDKEGDAVYRVCHAILDQLPNLQWLGYLSTTGVYGDHAGGWVDESTPTHALDDRVCARIKAEQLWLSLVEKGVPVHIFRLAGIYGPGNSPIERVARADARRIIKHGQVFSRIHVDDIATILMASMAKPDAGAIYNVCDDLPAPAEEVVEYAAKLLGMDVPPAEDYDTAPMSAMMRSFYSANRRVKNNKIKDQLGVELAYPTYKQGLDAIFAARTMINIIKYQ